MFQRHSQHTSANFFLSQLFNLYTKTEALVFELQSKLVNCAATVPLEEYRMLQRELEESTDEVWFSLRGGRGGGF